MRGYRKVIVFTEALAGFLLALWFTGIRDSGAIASLGISITGLLSAAIYGNVKEHELSK